MTTLVLDEKTEQTPIGSVIRSATDSVVEIRDEDGSLVATLMFPDEVDDFDYGPYMAEAQRVVEEYKSRPPDPRPPLTTQEFLESLRRLGPAE
jgi:hypothetical protein